MGERGERDDDNGERRRLVFIIVVDVNVDAVNSNPSYQAPSLPLARLWGKGATVLMLWRHVRRWHWLGGEREKERRSLVLEEVGLNNQHEAGGEGSWREIDKDNN